MNTTRFSGAAGDASAALASRYFARLGQSASVCSICATRCAAMVSSADVDKGAAGADAGAVADEDFCGSGADWALADGAAKNASPASTANAAITFEKQLVRGFITGLYNS